MCIVAVIALLLLLLRQALLPPPPTAAPAGASVAGVVHDTPAAVTGIKSSLLWGGTARDTSLLLTYGAN